MGTCVHCCSPPSIPKGTEARVRSAHMYRLCLQLQERSDVASLLVLGSVKIYGNGSGPAKPLSTPPRTLSGVESN